MIADGGGHSGTRYWLLLVLSLSIVPVSGLFTTSRVFYIRDLSFFFWSRHLWIRHTLLAGRLPWWDPFVAGGQSAVADALNQLLMPITLAIRLLPSDVVAFNLWIALPVPLAAAGMFLFLRRDLPPHAAALGACAFALSGPVVSMVNLPNLSWSVALLPWVMASVGAPWRGRFGGPLATAVAFALQALCGEPVTWAATGALAAAYAIFRLKAESTERRGEPAAPDRSRGFHLQVEGTIRVIGGLAAGALLAAIQLVPTLVAGIRAHRGALATPDFWSLHPLSLWEALAPHLFGNYYDAFLADLPWMGALNFGRDPFFYSIYIGPLVLLLAGAGLFARPRRTSFWAIAAVVFVAAALGGYTPFYPFVRRLVPALMYFRFPVKYIVFAVFACAVMASEGLAWLTDGDRPIAWLPPSAGSLATVGLLISIAALFAPDAVFRASHALAVATHLKDPEAGAAFLSRIAPPLALRASGLLLAGCVLMAIAAGRGRAARGAALALSVAVCADLLITNSRLNLTMDAATLQPPAWFTATAGPQRVYLGGRVRGHMNTGDPDATPTWQIPAAATAIEGRMQLNALLPMAPSGWGVREALSYDLPYLWPNDYEAVVRRFEGASREERDAFLRRSGVRWCVLPVSQRRSWRAIADVSDWNMRVYDCHPDAARMFIASTVEIAGDPSDVEWQRAALFDPSLTDDTVRLDRMPAAAGREGPPEPAFARFIDDGDTTVSIEAAVPRPSMLVLRDSFEASWTLDVDGRAAEIARANGRYRAVALRAGRHVIRFDYRPRDLRIGLIITVMTVLGVGFIGFIGFKGFRFE
jgi:hypothetical protein